MHILLFPIIIALPFAFIADQTADPRPQWTAATARAAASTFDAIEEGLCALATDHPLLRLARTCPEQEGADGLDRRGLSLSFQHLPLGNYRECPGVIVRVRAVPPGEGIDERVEGSDYQIRCSRRSRAGPGYLVLVYARDDAEPALADVVLSVVLSTIESAPVAPNPGMQRTRCARR
jgi:hypothetical protein